MINTECYLRKINEFKEEYPKGFFVNIINPPFIFPRSLWNQYQNREISLHEFEQESTAKIKKNPRLLIKLRQLHYLSEIRDVFLYSPEKSPDYRNILKRIIRETQ